MTLFISVLIMVYLSTFVAGQILLKRAMSVAAETWRQAPAIIPFVSGIAAMTVSFFVKLGLLQRFELSYLFPFQGLTVIAVAAASATLLRERLTSRFWLGAALVSVGVITVSAT